MTDEGLSSSLAAAYDRDAARRDAFELEPWRVALLDQLAAAVPQQSSRRVLELGAGTGQMAAHLATHGLDVLAVDLSPENVERARHRGVEAIVADFATIDLPPASFAGAVAFNSMLHIPRARVVGVLERIAGFLSPGAPFLVVVWGGHDWEGILDGDEEYTPRFFSFLSDESFTALEPRGLRTLRIEILDHIEGRDGRHPQVRVFARE